MTALAKAVLEELDRNGKVKETIPVQFNPTSLRLQMTNSIDGAKSRGRQVQQYNGTSSTTLSIQLEFDTADEGTTEDPLDVRVHTSKVARFVLPSEDKKAKLAPPRVGFRWGKVDVRGVMASLTEELDLFSAEGVPLRAKVSIEIKEQDPKFEARTNPDTKAPPAGESGCRRTGPGTSSAGGGGPDQRTVEALDGESAADFLVRNGVDPAAWRAIAGALENPLSLPAGFAVDFSDSLSTAAGVGASAGFGAALDMTAAASLGLEAGAGIGIGAAVGVDVDLAAGFALAAAGGITAGSQTAAAAAAASAAGRAKAAFGVPASPGAAGATPAGQTALASEPSARTLRPVAAPPRPLPPRADPRAVTFGRGVPLRDRVTPPAAAPGTGGYVVIAPRTPSRSGPAGCTDGGCRR